MIEFKKITYEGTEPILVKDVKTGNIFLESLLAKH